MNYFNSSSYVVFLFLIALPASGSVISTPGLNFVPSTGISVFEETVIGKTDDNTRSIIPLGTVMQIVDVDRQVIPRGQFIEETLFRVTVSKNSKPKDTFTFICVRKDKHNGMFREETGKLNCDFKVKFFKLPTS